MADKGIKIPVNIVNPSSGDGAPEGERREQRDAAAGQSPPPRHPDEEQEQGGPGFVVNDRRFWNLSDEELAAEAEKPSKPSYIVQLEQQLEEKDRQLKEYIKAYKTEVGENLEKTRKRLERDAMAQLERARTMLTEPMLEVLDALERSIVAGQQTGSAEALLEGVKMVHLLMVQKLGQLGLQRIEAVGQPFDPNLHEALAVAPVDDPAQHNVVLQEFKPGFAIGDRVVRPAQVQVGKAQ